MILNSEDSVSTVNHSPVNNECGEEVELESTRAVFELPTNTIEITINAVVYNNGELMRVFQTFGVDEVRKAFRRGEDCIEDDDVWQLTDKGREYVEKCAT